MLSVDTNILRHVPRRSSTNCDLQFANTNIQTDRLKENYSIDGHMMDFFLVCLSVSPSLPLVSFGQLLSYADKCFVNIMKVYIERNNLQVELIGCRNFFYFIHVHFCKSTDSMQYRPPPANQEVPNTNHFGPVSGSLHGLRLELG